MSNLSKIITKSKARIFICYRRSDTSGEVGRLVDHLETRFGKENIFRDIDSISGGSDFDQDINNYLNECNIFLCVIGKRWTTGDGTVNRLKEDPGDFVRKEIVIAIKRGIVIIPVLVQRAGFPLEKDIPGELLPLTKRQAEEIRDSSWDYDVSKLTNSIRKKSPAVISWPKAIIIALGLAALIIGAISLRPGGQKTIENPSSSNAPLLQLSSLPHYGYTLRDNGMVPITVNLKTINNAPAKNISVNLIALKEFLKGSFRMARNHIREMTDGTKSSPDKGLYTYVFRYEFKSEDDLDIEYHDTYFYLSVSYTDNAGKPQEPIRNIYLLLASSHKIMEINTSNDRYNGIKEFLRVNEKW